MSHPSEREEKGGWMEEKRGMREGWREPQKRYGKGRGTKSQDVGKRRRSWERNRK